jgi:hypothetical protein
MYGKGQRKWMTTPRVRRCGNNSFSFGHEMKKKDLRALMRDKKRKENGS